MMDELICSNIITKYLEELGNNFTVQNIDRACFIVTPFLDPSGDAIEIKVEIIKDKVNLSDNGNTYDYLFLNGVELTENRKRLITMILKNNEAFLHNESEITVVANYNEGFGNAVQRLLRAINSIQYLVYTLKPSGKKRI